MSVTVLCPEQGPSLPTPLPTSPAVCPTDLAKLERILESRQYGEMLENCKNFNGFLMNERKTRVPFIDQHTGLAQSDCRLWLQSRQRMPPLARGQLYTYPAARWIKRRRTYLASFMQQTPAASFRRPVQQPPAPPPPPQQLQPMEDGELTIAAVENPGFGTNDDSNTSGTNDASKEAWFYGDMDMDPAEFAECSDTSDLDFEDRSRKKKKASASQKRTSTRSAGSRKKTTDQDDESRKQWVCELCPARYKTRPGLTYHYAHSHKEERDMRADSVYEPPFHTTVGPDQLVDRDDVATDEQQSSRGAKNSRQSGATGSVTHTELTTSVSPVMELTAPASTSAAKLSSAAAQAMEDKKRCAASDYCDFCLGDKTCNKKTGQSEQLVSCADCGRSGHPTCLQFTDNMIVSVAKYRWQCIECKCCSLCGTSDNDDQLLFCDDCDRGYHMYCLTPPLLEPPEGCWSCQLCLVEFHSNNSTQ